LYGEHTTWGRPIPFDRFYAASLGSKAVDLLAEGRNNAVLVRQYHVEKGFHARPLGPEPCAPDAPGPLRSDPDEAVEDGNGLSVADLHRRHRHDDAEHMRQTLFDAGNRSQYHSVNTDVQKRIRYLEAEGD
jgi:6-phosphofructokinase 1